MRKRILSQFVPRTLVVFLSLVCALPSGVVRHAHDAEQSRSVYPQLSRSTLRELQPANNTSLEEDIRTGLEEFSEAQIQAEAELAVRPLLAAEMLRVARPPSTTAPRKGPLILFQALWLAGLYPPMTEELKSEIGIVEVTTEELKRLARIAPAYNYPEYILVRHRTVITPANLFPIPDAMGKINTIFSRDRIEQLQKARFILVRYKIPSGRDPDSSFSGFGQDSEDFPRKPWGALMMLHKALSSDILMIDYARTGISYSMRKASLAFWGSEDIGRYMLSRPDLLPNGPIIRDGKLQPNEEYRLEIPQAASYEPSLFFVRPNETYIYSLFDPEGMFVTDRTPERHANDRTLTQRLSQAVLVLYHQKMHPTGLEEQVLEPLTYFGNPFDAGLEERRKDETAVTHSA